MLALCAAPASRAADGDGATCIPPVTHVALDTHTVGADTNGAPALGTYERISPDGRFILRSYSGAQLGQVSLIELSADGSRVTRTYRTPLSNEAFPVQGTWRYLVDVNGEHYRFADVLRQQTQARSLFKGGMTGFYAAASEMGAAPDGNALPARFALRSLSWPTGSADDPGTGPLQLRTLLLDESSGQPRVVGDSGQHFICASRTQLDGSVYALPMISVDGLAFSAVPQNPKNKALTMRVYGLSPDALSKNHPCDLRSDLGHAPGKAVFGFTQPSADGQKPAWLAYTLNGNVQVYRPATAGQPALTLPLDAYKTQVIASAFPGLTRDGRVIFAATWKECDDLRCPDTVGYVIADPYQTQAWRQHVAQASRASSKGKDCYKNDSNLCPLARQPAPKLCITRGEVATERQRFARWHGLTP